MAISELNLANGTILTVQEWAEKTNEIVTVVNEVTANTSLDAQITNLTNYVNNTFSTNTHVNTVTSANNLLVSIKTVDGTGSGLDADLLDGKDSTYFLPATSYTADDVFIKVKSKTGQGSGLDADTLDGKDSTYFLPAATFNSSYTASDVLTKIKTVDGAGSGLDTDLFAGYNLKSLSAYQSTRDFPNGTLIKTTMNTTSGFDVAFMIEITGNSYGGGLPIDTIIQGYFYQNAFMNLTGLSNGYPLSTVSVFSYNNRLCLWFPYQSYWQGFKVFATNVNSTGPTPVNLVDTITNNVKPSPILSETVVPISSAWTSTNIGDATPSVHGFMTASDKSKLNGIESGATADQTASEILNLLKTVDGDGSGLDADLLDGQTGSYYTNAGNFTGTFAGAVNGTTVVGTSPSSSGFGVRGYANNGTTYGILGYNNTYSFYGSGSLYNSGSGSFTGSLSSASLSTGTATVSSLTSSGGITSTSGYITASQGVFIGRSDQALLCSDGSGIIYLRPNGVGSSAGQFTVDYNGRAIVNGNLTVNSSANIYGSLALSYGLSCTSIDCNTILSTSTSSGGYGVYGRANNTSIYGILGYANVYSFYGSGTMYNSGSITASGDVTAYSDASLKENVKRIENPFDIISKLNGYFYNRNDINDNDKRHTGVIAQEVQKVLPEIVTKNKDGLLSVAYGNFAGVFIEAIKELKSENDDLKKRLEKLEGLLLK